MKFKKYLIYMFPLFIFSGIYLNKLFYASINFGVKYGVLTAGFGFIIVSIFVILFFIMKTQGGQIIINCIGLISIIPTSIMFWSSDFTSFIWFFLISLYLFGFSIYSLIEIQKAKKKMNQKNKSKMKIQEENANQMNMRKIMAISLSIVILISIIIATSLSPLYFLHKPITYNISSSQTENYELVLYYPVKTDIDENFCLIMQEADVDTVSFQMNQYEFEEGSQFELNAAYAVRNLTNYGIKVEIWPLFNVDDGHYPSISEIERFPELYDSFHNWTVRNSLTVDYILWDIESEGERADTTQFENWIEPFKSFGYAGAYGLRLSELSKIWENANEAIIDLAQEANTDGHIVRTTTHTIIWDVFDGDGQMQMVAGIPAWDSKEAYEYISMMSYRGCEWGGTPGSSTWIYEHVKASKITQENNIAICLGCLNYNPYPNITSVTNDVYLSLAAGANSVRLFQGASWVYGVGENEEREIWGGITHGFNSTETEGLLQLLEACREPGSVIYQPDCSIDYTIFGNFMLDCLLDFI